MKSFKDYSKILEQIDEMDCDGSCISFKEVSELDKKIDKKFVDSLQDAGDKEWRENDELLSEYANEYFSAGFINGFIRAMYIMYKTTALQEEAKVV